MTTLSRSHIIADPRTAKVFRYAFGSTLAMALAMGIDWPLSFLVPVLSLSFLAAPRPTLKAGGSFIAAVTIACLAGGIMAKYFLDYPLVFLLLSALVLFRIFYAKANGAPPLLILWMLIAVLLIPLVALLAPQIAAIVVHSLLFGAIVALSVAWLAHAVFPDPPVGTPGAATAQPAAAPPTREQKIENATLSTAVLFPLMVAFFVFQWTSSLLILIFVAILSQQPGFASNWKTGVALIIGNVLGGIASIVFYELLTVVPEYTFMLLLTLLFALLFGSKLFSDSPKAPLFGMAFSTVLLVIASTTTSTNEAGSKVYTRILQIMMAVSYVVVAFGTIEWFRRGRAA